MSPVSNHQFFSTFLILEQTKGRESCKHTGGVVMYLLLTGGSVGWMESSRPYTGGDGTTCRAVSSKNAEVILESKRRRRSFPTCVVMISGRSGCSTGGEDTAKCGALRDFFVSFCKRWEFLAPHMTMVIFTILHSWSETLPSVQVSFHFVAAFGSINDDGDGHFSQTRSHVWDPTRRLHF